MTRKTPKRTPKRKRVATRRAAPPRVDDAPVDHSVHVMVAGKHMSVAEMHTHPAPEAAQPRAQPGIAVTPALGHALPGDSNRQAAASNPGAPVILGFAARVRAAKRGAAPTERSPGGDHAADQHLVPVRPE